MNSTPFDDFLSFQEFRKSKEEHMEKHDLDINNDLDHVKRIMKGLEKFDGGCPCILAHPKCPCEESIGHIEKTGSCHCKLFFKKRKNN